MRVVFFGTPQFAVPSLKALLSSGAHSCELVGVITQPDRPVGRGMKVTPTPVKVVALEAGLDVFQPRRLRNNPEARVYLREKDPQLIVVAAFGQLLPIDVLGFSPWGSINVHPSLLPRYRGAAPVIHAVLNGDKITGVTIMKLDEGMDTGEILSQTEMILPENTSGGELEEILAHRGAELLVETIPRYLAGEIQPRAQEHEKSSSAPRVKKEEARVDWSLSAAEVHNRIRAFNPRPVAYAALRGQTVRIWRSATTVQAAQGTGRPGVVVAVEEDAVVTECGLHTFLSLRELQLPNRGRVAARDFVNGVGLKVGEMFT